MPNSKPTPGPWHVLQVKTKAPQGKAVVYAADDDLRIIARCDDRLNFHEVTDNEANARLIAAAPDLLSIVERFVALPSCAWHPERHAADEAELMADARAAIAKARGEA